MSWRTDLLDRLEGAGDITSVAGTNIGWTERKRSQPFPAIVLHEISDGVIYSHDGANPYEDPLVQTDIWVVDPDQLEVLEAAVRALVENGGTQGNTVFEPGFLIGRRTMQPEDLDDGVRVFGLQMDFSIPHSPAS